MSTAYRRLPRARRFYLARVYANFDEAVRTVELVSEHSNLERAEGARRTLARAGEAEHTLLLVAAGRSWAEAERELEARLGD